MSNSVAELDWAKRLSRLEHLASKESPAVVEYIHAVLQHVGSEDPDWTAILTAFLDSEPKDAKVRAVGIRAWEETDDDDRKQLRVRLILNDYPKGEYNDPNGGYMLCSEIKRRLHGMIPPSWRLNVSPATEAEWRAIENRKDYCDREQIKLGRP